MQPVLCERAGEGESHEKEIEEHTEVLRVRVRNERTVPNKLYGGTRCQSCVFESEVRKGERCRKTCTGIKCRKALKAQEHFQLVD